MKTNTAATNTAATVDTATATGLLTDALELAWSAIRGGMNTGGAIDHSEHYTDELHSACQRVMEAGLALEAAVEAAAKRLGVEMMADVLEPIMDRVACAG